MSDKITLPRHLIEDALSDAGVWDFSVREEYSGRYMYGKTGFGVTMPWDHKERFLSSLKQIVVDEVSYDPDYDDYDEEAERELEEAKRKAALLVNGAHTDNMGRDMILYFPGVTLEG